MPGPRQSPGLYDLLVIALLFAKQIARARMHTAFSALTQLQQQQCSQQMRAASEIAQRSFEPLPILSFVKAQRKELRVASACDERTSESNQR